MSVSSTDLKSMLSKVRKADNGAPPPPPPPTPVAPPPAPAATAAATAVAPPDPEESYDLDSILREIATDEELLLRILGLLYRAKKRNPNGGAVSIIEMEKKLSLVRESATFVINYMKARKLIETNDKSANMITVEGIEYLRNTAK